MAKMLFSTTDRDIAHQWLSSTATDPYPFAECREDINAAEPYQVWSDRVDRDAEIAAARVTNSEEITPSEDRIARRMIELLEARGK